MLLLGDWKRPFDHTDQLEDSSAPLQFLARCLPCAVARTHVITRASTVSWETERRHGHGETSEAGLPPEIVLEMVGLEWLGLFPHLPGEGC